MPAFDRRGWSLFVGLVRPFLRSERRGRAGLLLGALVLLLLTLSALNVASSFVNRDVMTALAERHSERFALLSAAWIGVFAVISTVAAFYRFTEERLALLWREWMTTRLIDQYLAERRFLAISELHTIDNPDQRISEDVKTFTVTTISLMLILLNSSITFVAFIGVLWAITPWLVLAAVLYAVIGTGATLLIGRRLVYLNNRQYAVEGNLRYDLARIREHAEPLALFEGGAGIIHRLHGKLASVVGNMRRIIAVSRNLGFSTTAFGYLTPVVPVLVVAPSFFRGEVEFGVVTQAAIAFAQVLGAFSLAITNFGQLSSLAAVVNRLAALVDALDHPPGVPADAPEVAESPDRWACERLTLYAPGGTRPRFEDLTFENSRDQRLLVLGPKGVGKTELFSATAGLRSRGKGRIVRPSDAAFLPFRPYYPPGTLREVLTDFGTQPFADEQISEILRRVGFGPIGDGPAVLDESAQWTDRLTSHDLQAISVARLLLHRPPWAFLNGVTSAFAPEQRDRIYQMLDEAGITYVTFSDDADKADFHDRILHLEPGGRWRIEERSRTVIPSRGARTS
jgi:vitamin B12/bleomycin/antimicrobial peptide transport system ATP-binding/permease protein